MMIKVRMNVNEAYSFLLEDDMAVGVDLGLVHRAGEFSGGILIPLPHSGLAILCTQIYTTNI